MTRAEVRYELRLPTGSLRNKMVMLLAPMIVVSVRRTSHRGPPMMCDILCPISHGTAHSDLRRALFRQGQYS